MAFEKFRKKINTILQRPGSVSLDQYTNLLNPIIKYSDDIKNLSDEEILEIVKELRAELTGVTKFSDEQLIKISGIGRDAGRRTLNQLPFDTQILGALGILNGNIIEMGTGEGKTLTGVLAAIGFALSGRNIHIITTNDYLAQRDAKWMQPLYSLLGISVGYIGEQSSKSERLHAYRCDVMHASVNEIGFDLLRDRLVTKVEDRVRGFTNVVIIDEVDSILIDEARVPLVLAGSSQDQAEANNIIKDTIKDLQEGEHYTINLDAKTSSFTESGLSILEKNLDNINIYEHSDLLAQANVSLYAHTLVKLNVDYLIEHGSVKLIDASRGRIAQLQRWPDGLQSAVEAKEGLAITDSGYILDSTTIQAIIRVYPTIAGMTGTGMKVAEQFKEFYDLDVLVLPPNKTNIRIDEADQLYKYSVDKKSALLDRIIEEHSNSRPLLIGTTSVAETEELAKMLQESAIECIVLNAKNEAEEAQIITNAGAPNSIIVSTQMAGRGVDIILGGKSGLDKNIAVDSGGLLVIGTSRYEIARLNDQLRGRAGRQGDPGGSVFFTSLEDDLLMKYASMDDLRGVAVEESGRVDSRKANNIVEHAQRVAEGIHRNAHRNTWRYNRLIEHQRNLVVEYRENILTTDWSLQQLATFSPDKNLELLDIFSAEELLKHINLIFLSILDKEWSNYLGYLSDLREGIHLRGLGKGIIPLDEFHKDAIAIFEGFTDRVKDLALNTCETIEITENGPNLEDAGFARPSSTWTYMVTDDPFGSDIDSIVSGLRRMFKKSNFDVEDNIGDVKENLDEIRSMDEFEVDEFEKENSVDKKIE